MKIMTNYAKTLLNQDYKKNIQFFNIQLTPIKDRRLRFILG